jgi:hypothetical protein
MLFLVELIHDGRELTSETIGSVDQTMAVREETAKKDLLY